MAHRSIGQLGFLDAALSRRGRKPGASGLDEIAASLDWLRLEALLSGIHASRRGQRAFPPVMMLKALLLQRWHDLSDEAMEDALADRLSFQRFCGLGLDDPIPDHSTIWRFRERLGADGLIDAVFAEVAAQLDAAGLVVRQGTLIDASLMTAAARRPRKDEGKTSRTDPDARFGANNERRRFSFGYKLHIAQDEGSAIVRGAVLTPANVQEISVAGALVQGDEAALFADRGYDARWLHARLADQNIDNGVMRRVKGRRAPLGEAAIARNHECSLRRRPVEATFGTLKQHYGLRRLRYFNLARNAVCLKLALIGYNLRRLIRLKCA